MLLRFYLFFLFMIIFHFILAWIKNHTDLQLRLRGLFVLLHCLTAALLAGYWGYYILILLSFSFCMYELAFNYKFYPASTTMLFTLLFIALSFADSYVIFLVPLFLFTALFCFAGPARIRKLPVFLLAIAFFIMLPCALSHLLLFKFRWEMILVIVLLLQLNDGFGYLFGKVFGKHYLFKNLSPKKTLEGYLFGFLGIILGIWILHTLIPVLQGNTLWQDMLLAVYMFAFGNVGDLTFSAIKRSLQIKDFGQILPGQGGLLDRLDNDFFVAPFFLLLTLAGAI